MEKITGKTFDEERALYHLTDAEVIDCTFAGPADGESALKECRKVTVKNCSFSLRYPLWHAENFTVENCRMDYLTRAALWYTKNGKLYGSTLGGIKALRECDDSYLSDCDIVSPEFGWRCRGVEMKNCRVESEYFLFECNNIKLSGVKMKKNSGLKGEYLGWYSDGLTLINCHIVGTQPLCYCKNLTLINCTTENCDLSFEYSDVNATINGHIVSVKNPKSGTVTVDSVDEIISGDCVMPCTGQVIVKQRKCG